MVTKIKTEENRKLPDRKEMPVGWHASWLQHHGNKLIIKGGDKKGQQISSHPAQYQDFKINRAQSDTKQRNNSEVFFYKTTLRGQIISRRRWNEVFFSINLKQQTEKEWKKPPNYLLSSVDHYLRSNSKVTIIQAKWRQYSNIVFITDIHKNHRTKKN